MGENSKIRLTSVGLNFNDKKYALYCLRLKAESTSGSYSVQCVQQPLTRVYSIMEQSNMMLHVLFVFNFVTTITTPQDAHMRLVLQVYLGSNTLEFSAIRR